MKYSLIAAALALIAGTSTVLAADAGFMPWTDVMKMYEHGKDAVTMDDLTDHDLNAKFPGFSPWFQDHFADLDANHDGKVDQAELEAMMHKMNWTDKQMVDQFYKNTGFMPANPANQ